MIVEKPAWLSHERMQIFSIDVQPGGHRLATAGGDHKVRIWDMKHLAPKDPISVPLTPKLLATLRDHFGSVNCVRWAKSGRFVASGSDDHIILIHDRRAGSGTTEFGSGEPPNVENWKVLISLRGHTADVVDLGWSPDDSLLASCSLDNHVNIWNASNGSLVTVLKGHTSLVKGITWDPVGSFLATQSDDRTVIVWRTSDWSLAHRIQGHWDKTVGSTFFRRLGWSPCGHFITTTNGFQKPKHSAPVLERGDWTATFDFLGHNAPVVAVRFNHSMFYRRSRQGGNDALETGKSGSGSQGTVANGGSKASSKESLPYNVIAMGSQDCSITVWTTTSARPIFVGKHFFTQSVVDLSWSPDGYSLLCCSLDGTVAAFHFEPRELGLKLSGSELDELKKSRYGDVKGRQSMLVESTAQLLLEAVAVKQWGGAGRGSDQSNPTTSSVQEVSKQIESIQVTSTNVLAGVGTTNSNGALTAANTKTVQPRVLSPVKQKECRAPDGRRRIIPEPLGPAGRQESVANGLHHGRTEAQLLGSDQKLEAGGLVVCGTGIVEDKKNCRTDNEIAELPAKRRCTVATKVDLNTLIVERGLTSADAAEMGLSFSQSDLVTTSGVQNAKASLSVSIIDIDGSGLPICLEARPLSTTASGVTSIGAKLTGFETEIVCSKKGEVQWRDRVAGKATVMAGNANLWAVGFEDGNLQVYTKSGRRALPCIQVGSAPAFLDCDKEWKLLVLTRLGSLYLWDFALSTCVLRESITPLLPFSVDSSSKGPLKVVSAKLSQCGAPLVILANWSAFLFHLNMRCWLRISDESFIMSGFGSSWHGSSAAGEGELSKLQAEAADAASKKLKWNRIFSDEQADNRVQLETQMAAALALKSAEEYRILIRSYARCLARETDEVRLREVCEELVGPPFSKEAHSGKDALFLGQLKQWDPNILGMKKHDLLRNELLPAMASNRKIQKLLNEVLDLLSESESEGPMFLPS